MEVTWINLSTSARYKCLSGKSTFAQLMDLSTDCELRKRGLFGILDRCIKEEEKNV